MGDERVVFDEQKVSRFAPNGREESVRWDDLQEVFILTTEDGPWAEDVFWMLAGTEGGCAVPSSALGFEELMERLQQLPGFDNEAVIAAMGCTEEAKFTCWKKSEADLRRSITESARGRLRIFAVLEEDVYETKLGDGYYAYFRRAFYDRMEAATFAEKNNGEWRQFHVRDVWLSLEGGEYRMEAELAVSEKVEVGDLVSSLVGGE